MAVSTARHTVLVSPREVRADRYTHRDAQETADGYDFHHPAVLQNVPPPSVSFPTPLRWWSLDRRRRLAIIMSLRDRLQNDILRRGRHGTMPSSAPAVSMDMRPARPDAIEKERLGIPPSRRMDDALSVA